MKKVPVLETPRSLDVPLPTQPSPEPPAKRNTFRAQPKHDELIVEPAPEAPPSPPQLEKAKLVQEADVVRTARKALRGGDTTFVIQLLDDAANRFGQSPAGGLAQEREALAVEALGRSGRSEEASSRGEEFLRKYPTSPYVSTVSKFVVRR